jgi:hypothetical protein
MNVVRRAFISLLTGLSERELVRRRQRVQCQPSGEQMEPRALLSELKVGVAILVPPRPAGGALVIPVDQAPAEDQVIVEHDIIDQINVEN